MIEFTSSVPEIRGHHRMDPGRADELVDACLGNAGEWAKVPIVWLYPSLVGADEKKHVTKVRNTATSINRGQLAPFDEFFAEAAARGTDLYVRITLTPRQRKELDL